MQNKKWLRKMRMFLMIMGAILLVMIGFVSLYWKAGERTNLQKGTKNKRTTISNDTPILIKSLQNASTHPLWLPLSPLSDASSALLAILSSGTFPSPSPNSTFTLICPSGFLWESSTTVSTWDEETVLMSDCPC